MEKDIATKHTREMSKKVNNAILKALATTELSHIAPLLSLARMVDSKANVGLTYSTCVEEIEIREMQSYTILRIVVSTVTASSQMSQKNISVLYTFRMITQSMFEPFVYISKNKNTRTVFAYVDESEFLFSNIEGTEKALLDKIYTEALELNKKGLARYIDLIRTGYGKGKAMEEIKDAE